MGSHLLVSHTINMESCPHFQQDLIYHRAAVHTNTPHLRWGATFDIALESKTGWYKRGEEY